ncbi:L,D-transpeptidase [Candidatus Aerophobetes bacterium]|uniref:L,D-transpeptidase n=1 Tax=Aerophobetes bacterium TaxID=2030807 RepID=A0A2A4YMA6_UNCAE|nr:MAG: L,D-transpeptidase [Candidatus Aerophobetes bacterium]
MKKQRTNAVIVKEQVGEESVENAEPVLQEKVYRGVITQEPEDRAVEIDDLDSIAVSEASKYKFVNNVHRFFTVGLNKFPFVETVSYKGRVSWLQGRPAWIADYASHFSTSRHFIARSLNGKNDYYTQKVSTGDKFNVFSSEVNLEFHLVLDISQHMMWFYAHDVDKDLRYFVRTYKVGCGRVDHDMQSGCLSPLGTFKLSDKIAIFKEGIEGYFKDSKIEMISVFGTRWIPYVGEEDNTLAMIKGYGIHGAPWYRNETTGELEENRASIGQYVSSGCVRLYQEDMEELFSIVITKPTTVQIVKTIKDAKLPGVAMEDLAIAASN